MIKPSSNPDNTTQEQPLSLAVTDESTSTGVRLPQLRARYKRQHNKLSLVAVPLPSFPQPDVLLNTRVRVSRKTTKPHRTHVPGSHKTWGSQLTRYPRKTSNYTLRTLKPRAQRTSHVNLHANHVTSYKSHTTCSPSIEGVPMHLLLSSHITNHAKRIVKLFHALMDNNLLLLTRQFIASPSERGGTICRLLMASIQGVAT
ncbi:hypothetical protein Taro_002949 [Colocasia esculenta]|uniref:Uncharacterized protein n=1 Tax=Colocasia esculenta TaxID=4460 RepID=A0A843TE34_COLES|nr:hypothetical protein [Colocasia esculenta]